MPPPARQASRSTSCGVAMALVLGIALISTGISITSVAGGSGDGTAMMDGAHVLRQARWTPQLRQRQLTQQQQQRTRGAASTLADSAKTVAAISLASEAAALSSTSPVVAGSCLVTKWAAVWLVHADRKTRSHVSAPTPSCDLHASEVEDIDRYTKAHGGAGAYSLSESDSRAACERPSS